MFDIGLSELVVIFVVALIVIGPERLPKVARTLGFLFGRLQRYVTQVKVDIQREMNMAEFEKMQSEINESVRKLERSVSTEVHQAQQELHNIAGSASALAAPPTSAAPPQLELGLQPSQQSDSGTKPQ